MYLKRFKINKLFGLFDHEVFFTDDLRIIHGENGIGKTKFLESIAYFLTQDFGYFFDLDFTKIEVDLKAEQEISIIMEKEEDNLLFSNKNNNFKLTITKIDVDEFPPYKKRRSLENIVLGFTPVRGNIWKEDKTGIEFDVDEVFDMYKYRFYTMTGATAFYQKKLEKAKVNLIQTQRIYNMNNKNERILESSEHIQILIKESIISHSKESSNLDNTFPNRLIEKINSQNSKKNKKLLNLKQQVLDKKKLLDKLGIVDMDSNIISEAELSDKNNDTVIDTVLTLFYEDNLKKLSKFDALANKITLFLSIVNYRFKYKKIDIDKNEGLIVLSNYNNQQRIPLSKLSSGEKHELLLFYDLIFRVEEGSIVLIDEPEISLHLLWQECFVDDLKKVMNLNKFSTLIATHSPDIIGEYLENTSSLKGIDENE